MRDAQAMLGESLSTAAQQQTMLYPRHTRFTLDRVARETWTLYRTAVCDIVAGQPEYVLPAAPFRIESICTQDGSGNVFPLAAITEQEADRQFWNWRTPISDSAALTGVPRYFVERGMMSFSLLPVPQFSVQDGLLITGYWGVSDWWGMDDESPLPSFCDEATRNGLCYLRCLEMQRLDPTYGPLIKQYLDLFTASLRDAYGTSLSATPARRGGLVPSRGSGMGAGGFGAGWVWAA